MDKMRQNLKDMVDNFDSKLAAASVAYYKKNSSTTEDNGNDDDGSDDIVVENNNNKNNNGGGGGIENHSNVVKRKLTILEKEVFEKMNFADELLMDVPDEVEGQVVEGHEAAKKQKENLLPKIDNFVPKIHDAVFVGHVVTDLDSIAGSIGAAELYYGTPAAASDVNSETAFALQRFNCPTPKRIEDIIEEYKTKNNDDNGDDDNDNDDPLKDLRICLIDHQQTSQMNPSIPHKNVVGIIDHHALQNKTVVTGKPIYCDIRPWGSASSIIGHSFIMQKRRPSVQVAGMLLCAILSDTLNLQSPTTTEWDKIMVTALADLANVDDIDTLAVEQFRAKSQELMNLSPYSLVNGDQKAFSFSSSGGGGGGFHGEVGFAVVETTDDESILARVHELVPELVAAKAEKNLDLIFLAVVNIVSLRSKLVLCGAEETSLAEQAYGGTISSDNGDGNFLMDLGSRVSRKREFIPAIASAIENGWMPSEDAQEELQSLMTETKQGNFGHLEVDPDDPANQVRSDFVKVCHILYWTRKDEVRYRKKSGILQVLIVNPYVSSFFSPQVQRVGATTITKRRPSDFLMKKWHSVR